MLFVDRLSCSPKNDPRIARTNARILLALNAGATIDPHQKFKVVVFVEKDSGVGL